MLESEFKPFSPLSIAIISSCKEYETIPTINFDYDPTGSGGGGEASALVNISSHVMKSVPLIDGSRKVFSRNDNYMKAITFTLARCQLYNLSKR